MSLGAATRSGSSNRAVHLTDRRVPGAGENVHYRLAGAHSVARPLASGLLQSIPAVHRDTNRPSQVGAQRGAGASRAPEVLIRGGLPRLGELIRFTLVHEDRARNGRKPPTAREQVLYQQAKEILAELAFVLEVHRDSLSHLLSAHKGSSLRDSPLLNAILTACETGLHSPSQALQDSRWRALQTIGVEGLDALGRAISRAQLPFTETFDNEAVRFNAHLVTGPEPRLRSAPR